LYKKNTLIVQKKHTHGYSVRTVDSTKNANCTKNAYTVYTVDKSTKNAYGTKHAILDNCFF